MFYQKFLEQLHEELAPKLYFEIGIRNGDSLKLAKCDAIGVDPHPGSAVSKNDRTIIFEQTSDEFFRTETLQKTIGGSRIDLAFIDGWHNSEFVIRDFMNTERFCSNGSVIVVDDVLPRLPDHAVRKPHGGAWTGDVWRAAETLYLLRPDLNFTFVDTKPTGLLVVQNLDPKNQVLREKYSEIEIELTKAYDSLMPTTAYIDRFVTPDVAMRKIRNVHGGFVEC